MNVIYTSRKHCEKESQSFFHCGFFDHPDVQLLNDYKFVFFGLPAKILGILGLLIYRLKLQPQKEEKRKNCSRLVTAD
jgi:hypothetical protein